MSKAIGKGFAETQFIEVVNSVMTFHYIEEEIKRRKRHSYYLRKVLKKIKKVKVPKIIRSKIFESSSKLR